MSWNNNPVVKDDRKEEKKEVKKQLEIPAKNTKNQPEKRRASRLPVNVFEQQSQK